MLTVEIRQDGGARFRTSHLSHPAASARLAKEFSELHLYISSMCKTNLLVPVQGDRKWQNKGNKKEPFLTKHAWTIHAWLPLNPTSDSVYNTGTLTTHYCGFTVQLTQSEGCIRGPSALPKHSVNEHRGASSKQYPRRTSGIRHERAQLLLKNRQKLSALFRNYNED